MSQNEDMLSSLYDNFKVSLEEHGLEVPAVEYEEDVEIEDEYYKLFCAMVAEICFLPTDTNITLEAEISVEEDEDFICDDSESCEDVSEDSCEIVESSSESESESESMPSEVEELTEDIASLSFYESAESEESSCSCISSSSD